VVHHVEPQLAPLGALQQPAAMGNAGKSTKKLENHGKIMKQKPTKRSCYGKIIELN